jgi:hypothetical protein
MSESTYGAATMIAAAYHSNDKENLDFLAQGVDTGMVTASTFQLVHMLLHSIPGGRVSNRAFDIREEAFDYFAEHVSKQAVKVSALTGADPRDVVTATTTVVMGSIVPLLEGDYTPRVNVDQEGISTYAFYILMASIAEAAVESFRAYVPLTDIFDKISSEPTYEEASDLLLALLPALVSNQLRASN